MTNTPSLIYKVLAVVPLVLLILTIVAACKPTQRSTQNHPPPSPNSFLIQNYLIDPENRTVYNRIYFEEDSGRGKNRIHSWGYRFEADTLIDFNTTCLYITDNQLRFKEHHNPSTEMVTSMVENHKAIEGYKHVNGFYEKDNQYFFLLSSTPYKFKPLEVPADVDFRKLSPAPEVVTYYNNQYYYDDNGLYFLDCGDEWKIVKVAAAKNCKPTLTPYCCKYNGAVYQNGKRIANASQVKTIDMKRNNEYVYLTDGKVIFGAKDMYYKELTGADKWVQLTAGEEIVVANNCAYLSVPKTISGNANQVTFSTDILFASPNGFFSIDPSLYNEPRKYDKVYIYSSEKGDDEELSTSEYRLYIQGFYTYRNVSYHNGKPLANNFDIPNLRRLEDGWLCDGKYLTHKDCLEWAENEVAFHPCVPVADISQLQFVDHMLLTDGVNFYSIAEHELKVMPIDKLGIKVEITLSDHAYEPSAF